MTQITHRSVLRIAIPIMLSNMSEPLIGVVNTAVMGRLPAPHYIGAIAVGSLIFSFLFWGFGFLRLSTSGLAAQATGAKDEATLSVLIWRSLTLAVGIGLVLLALGPWIGPLAVALVGGSPEVMHEAQTYFSYRIWAAPAALANFAILGWFIGQGRANIAFITQLFLNLTNMALSVIFVVYLHMATEGVGLAVIIAEYTATALGLALMLRRLRTLHARPQLRDVFQRAKVIALISANSDIMIRTFALVFAFGWFVSRGAKSGDLIIAANAVSAQPVRSGGLHDRRVFICGRSAGRPGDRSPQQTQFHAGHFLHHAVGWRARCQCIAHHLDVRIAPGDTDDNQFGGGEHRNGLSAMGCAHAAAGHDLLPV